MASDYEHTGIARCSVPESLEEAVDALKGCTLGGRISCDAKVTPDTRVSPGANIYYAPPASRQQGLRDARPIIQFPKTTSWGDEAESPIVLAGAGHFMVASCEPGDAQTVRYQPLLLFVPALMRALCARRKIWMVWLHDRCYDYNCDPDAANQQGRGTVALLPPSGGGQMPQVRSRYQNAPVQRVSTDLDLT